MKITKSQFNSAQPLPPPGHPVFPVEKPFFQTHEPHGHVHVQNRSVFLQIDGLTFAAYQMAEKMGIIPENVKRYFEKNGYRVEPFLCGQGSTTPSSTAGFLYGSNNGIPAFRFRDPKTGKPVSANNPFDDPLQYLHGKQPGLLEEGTVYSMLFTGDSHQSMFVKQDITKVLRLPSKMKSYFNQKREAKENPVTEEKLSKKELARKWLGISLNVALRFLLMVGSPGGALYAIADTAFVFLKNVIEAKGKSLGEALKSIPKSAGNAVTGTFLADLSISNLQYDIKRGIPVMWADFDAYDAAAHLNGPFSKEAMSTLKDVFKRVSRVISTIEAHPEWDYHLYIVSDHGQTPSRSFHTLYGEKLQNFVQEQIPGVPIQLAASGGHANIYFSNLKKIPNQSEIEKEHPGFIEKLVSHPGIGLIVGHEGDEILITSKQGKLKIKNGKIVEGNREILSPYGPPDLVAFEINHEASMDTSGHLILYGTFTPTSDGSGFQVDFEDFNPYKGSHGSIGGHQGIAVIAHAQRDPIDTKQIMGSWDLHYQLYQNLTQKA
jgi:hypothetical protein